MNSENWNKKPQPTCFTPTLRLLCAAIAFCPLLFSGCGADTKLNPIAGKVTLDGKGYSRLLVYFRPTKGKPNQFNMGVGETDENGILTLRSSGGDGLIAGTYRVAFTYLIVPGQREPAGLDEKLDGPGMAEPIEKVPALYADWENSPVMFTVKHGSDNYFEFDIPAE